MLVDELIEVVEKMDKCSEQRKTATFCCGKDCADCENCISYEQRKEALTDIQMRLKQEKWARDKMEEMRVEEVD